MRANDVATEWHCLARKPWPDDRKDALLSRQGNLDYIFDQGLANLLNVADSF